MTTKQVRVCDGCGADLTDKAITHHGSLFGQAFLAAGTQDWHSCSAACASKYLRATADAVDKFEVDRVEREKALAAQRAEQEAARAKEQAENAERRNPRTRSAEK